MARGNFFLRKKERQGKKGKEKKVKEKLKEGKKAWKQEKKKEGMEARKKERKLRRHLVDYKRNRSLGLTYKWLVINLF